MEEIWTTCSVRAQKSKLAIVDEKATLGQKTWKKKRKEQCSVAEWRTGDEEKRGESQGSCREAKVKKKQNLTELDK